MSLVSQSTSADNKDNIQKYEELMNEIKGQTQPLNKLNSIKSSDTIDNGTSIRSIKEHIKLGKTDLLSLCPILLYQAVTRSGCITEPLLPSESHHDVHHIMEDDRKMGKQQIKRQQQQQLAKYQSENTKFIDVFNQVFSAYLELMTIRYIFFNVI